MESLTEPVRKSVLDVLQYNLRAAGCKTYVTRVVYFGEYRGTHEVLRERMESIIRDLRMDYNNVPITGLFLVYPTCYVHVLEAWEDIIYKHYELMYAADDDECKFGKAIPLPPYHHVHQRFFAGWCHVHAVPPTLIGTLEARTLDEILKQVSSCLIKVYALCEYIASAVREKVRTILQSSKGDVRQRETLSVRTSDRESIDAQDALRNLGDKAARYLPESTALESLLNVNAPVLKTVEEHLREYSDASLSAFWDDNNVWPPPCDIMPRDVFDGRREAPNRRNSEK